MSNPPQPYAFQRPLSSSSSTVELSTDHGAPVSRKSPSNLKRKLELLQDCAKSDDEEEHDTESDSDIVKPNSDSAEQIIFADESSEDNENELNHAHSTLDPSTKCGSSNYEPLNYGISSIRLLQVHSDTSPEGQVQCTMQHATIDAEYTCLSYVWGPTDAGQFILLDGRRHKVRKNLLDFLEMARTRHTDKLLWIDALCIDQENDIERNHQVQQMGEIFSQARSVLAWFGGNTTIESHIAELSQREKTAYADHESFALHWSREIEFFDSPYWTRAWVTQEVLLARHLTLCAGHAELDAEHLREKVAHSYPATVRNLIAPETQVKRSSLIALIQAHHAKACHIPRDLIYSLLSICDEGSRIRVDYKASSEEVMLETIRSCPKNLCLCSIRCVARVFDCNAASAKEKHRGPPWKRIKWYPNEKEPQQRQHDEARSVAPPVPAEPLFASIRASTVTMIGDGLTCWSCGLTSIIPKRNHVSMSSAFVVCLGEICRASHGHIVVWASLNNYRIRRCIFVDWIYRETILALSDVRLTTNTPGDGHTAHLGLTTFELCISFTLALAIERLARQHNDTGLCSNSKRRTGLIHLCEHDSHR